MIQRKSAILSGLLAMVLGSSTNLCWAQLHGQEEPEPEAATTEPAAAATPAAPPVEPAVPPVPAPPPAATLPVVIRTAMGEITLALEIERAPITAKNFLRYVDNKRFDGMTFYRGMKLDDEGKYGLVQGGIAGVPGKPFPPIAHESPLNTGLSHVNGAVSMARGAPGTAMGDFFIVIGDLVSMDGNKDGSDLGYAVFGHVTAGMEVVKAILELPKSEDARNPIMKGQMLAAPVKIISVRRVPVN
jgi:peptidyl-prolyl cis-trans isomerase A (cyclophilin A)